MNFVKKSKFSFTLHLVLSLGLLASCMSGCSGLRLPAIDPSGERFFLPSGNYTTLNTPEECGGCGIFPEPAFSKPANPPRCDAPSATLGLPEQNPCFSLQPAKQGELVLIPTDVVAPVTAEVIVVGGICGANGQYVPGRKLEWTLSQESVGNFLEVGSGPHATCVKLVHHGRGKQSANYATSTTSRHSMRIDRGTASTLDDVAVSRGQSWITVSSPTEGTSYITCWSPATEGWDKRRKTTRIHWLDATWSLPANAAALSGQEHELEVIVQKETNGQPVQGWQVEFEVLPGSVPVGFSPTLSTKAKVTTDEYGKARIKVRQPTDQIGPGVSNVKVTLIRPENQLGTKERLEVASNVTAITWSAPALTLRASGPPTVGQGGQLVYQVDVSNPGDLPAENVRIAIGKPEGIDLVSSSPNPTEYGAQWIWQLGTLPPRSTPQRISVVARAVGRGQLKTCFVAAASNIEKQIEACVDTRIETPCLGFRFESEPQKAQVGQVANYRMVITNQCEQPLSNVRVEADFDPGFQLPGESSPIGLEPFDLPFGGSRTIDLPLQVASAGNHCLRLAITADGGHTLRAQTCLLAEQTPVAAMDIRIQGPQMIKVGQLTPYVIEVVNTGNVALEDLEFHARFSEGLAPIDCNLTLNWREDVLVGRMSDLEPNTSSLVNLSIEGVFPTDEAAFEVWAVSGNLETETRVAALQVMPPIVPVVPATPGLDDSEGPAMNGPDIRVPDTEKTNKLVLSLTKLTDPIDLGEPGGLLIGIINDRDQMDQNIEILVILPPGLEYLGAKDDSLKLIQDPENPQLLRGKRREVRAGDELALTVRVNPVQVGDQTVEVQLISDGTPQALKDQVTLRVNP